MSEPSPERLAEIARRSAALKDLSTRRPAEQAEWTARELKRLDELGLRPLLMP